MAAHAKHSNVVEFPTNWKREYEAAASAVEVYSASARQWKGAAIVAGLTWLLTLFVWGVLQ